VTATRSSMLVPEDWNPRRGNRVSLLPTKDDPRPAPGVWFVLDRAPDGRWLQPHDEAARTWADKHAQLLTQRCLQLPGRRLVPPGYVPRPPERKRPR
jgi:hypothetical protein